MDRFIKEGQTEIYIPDSNDLEIPSASASVFYNPEMELNRDINVAATSVCVQKLIERKGFEKSNITYLDAFAASGIRGLRVAKEIGISAVLNDWKEEAVSLIKRNISHNQLDEIVFASHQNANQLLCSRKFAIVDIDPFGTPSPFLDAAASSATFFLGVTATDTAPLCGAHLKSGMRKYSAVPFNNEFHSEMGLRILIGSIARETAKYDKGIKILLSHATRHYVRVYTEILHGAQNADKTIGEIGFAAWCPKCGSVETKKGLAVFMDERCPFCQKKAEPPKRKISGPLWLGPLKEIDFCDQVIQELEKENLSLNKKDEAKKLLTLCRNEAEIPFFYDQHLLCETLKISAPAIEPFLENLRHAGYTATRTHFSGTSFKSDAPLDTILEILKKSRLE
ncbi:MAG: tRNA (guanine(10)-N(2))-dimethyltransferase [Methanimicrococcus sp.]|nr:tRNA (guanine(10)-N(2))-dimethyltransferase [Methanimicrococcus sp.]